MKVFLTGKCEFNDKQRKPDPNVMLFIEDQRVPFIFIEIIEVTYRNISSDIPLKTRFKKVFVPEEQILPSTSMPISLKTKLIVREGDHKKTMRF